MHGYRVIILRAIVTCVVDVLAQAGIVTRTQQGVSVYYEIANPLLFEVCDLVCESLVAQMQQQNQQLEQLRAIKSAV